MSLPDPRQYATLNIRHPVIEELARALQTPTASHPALTAEIEQLLASQSHASLHAALAQAPSATAAQLLWQTLRKAVETAQTGELVPFLLPVILVAGSKTETQLPGALKDTVPIQQLLSNAGLWSTQAPCWLSPILFDSETIAQINPAQLWAWRQQTDYAQQGLPLPTTAVAIPLKDQAVYLRYLAGATLKTSEDQPLLAAPIGAWALPLAELLGQQLATSGVTLFPIPRAPMSWLAAQDTGHTCLLETRMQVMVSDALHTLRHKGRTPVATLAAHQSDEIRLTLSSLEDAERWYGYVWPLTARDHLASIEQQAIQLLQECQVDDIRIVPDLQPDLVDDLPFFATAHIAPYATN